MSYSKLKSPTEAKLYSECFDLTCLKTSAIKLAKGFGINLIAGRETEPDGNCMISFPADQLEMRFHFLYRNVYRSNNNILRNCFKNCIKSSSSIQHDRVLYAENGKRIFRGSDFDPGLTDEEWNTGWGLMGQDKTYEVSYFGDLMFMSLYPYILVI